MKRKPFNISFGKTTLVGDSIHTKARPQWLFLHGAGLSDRKRFEQFRMLLAQRGIASSSFDFIGHGETGGDLAGSSLESRVAQAAAVIDSWGIPQPLSIVASSMGGYIGIKLTKLYDIQNLVLLAPAAYAMNAYSSPFGPVFTEAIRSPFSWRETDAWEILKNFKGNLLIYAAEKDRVIPHEIIERMYDSARNARFREMNIVKDATHSLAKWLDEQPDSLHEIVEKVLKLSKIDS
ncbi:hypothetical protein A3I46_03330 [Candidatus Kaiserbacteria bacterium RIFCSPLOWO2_02_FULL_54_13]|uniref:Serine aminopeptidase S33 domain-containing protein n=1 Tax=Candidatus Kaiserbacteria bacterium RIFCSPHIGHO2_02_FULL_54_22 TaxID=1798495 RepID=A0A1F6DM99_9BACT|nr:MAG: hypothetical protein UY91_C0034G0010 [Parcubacteria group bacterium GW2011_GWB1_55_9]OGG62565.1 MAG: hypothetical protein A3C19_01120 [Candidatus Kaiserbacteria bacterium RIFCSPHIGHO2_02_FULL_54_22]OGG68156.1 MAG: hypothetical protein A3E99_03145 [Candidatus Kaiserbacteria bacterium RIFCSPHIGHO2_12_FULL_54_16]OGG82505.1 MAG: hypothetical protein A3I46_03330 [Candidatus Kaiserbacteria bacterium RIFCSPLOWO2_02_FULL_54_13]OGG89823.1 MAG: hypothetical protein A3G12_01975 [Candidatus Kaiserb